MPDRDFVPPFGRLFSAEAAEWWDNINVSLAVCRWCGYPMWRQLTFVPHPIPQVWHSAGYEMCGWCDVGYRLDGEDREVRDVEDLM